MTVGTAKETPIDDATKKVLDSADDFFSDGPVAAAGAAKDKVDLNAILGDKTKRAELATVDSGSWHNLMIRLNDGVSPSQTISELNKVFSEKNWPLKAVGWKEAAGTSAALTDVAQIIFNIVVIILAIVAVIIIINTLVISVMERTAEIGTMRALGAQKPFVRQLFVWETMLLAGFFGLVGIVIGSLSVVALNLIGLPLDNEFLQVLFGSKNLKPELSLVQVVLSIGFTLFIGVVSWIYPVSIALKVSPLKAIASE
jgi:putative ABC transport system permease protein